MAKYSEDLKLKIVKEYLKGLWDIAHWQRKLLNEGVEGC